MSPPPPEPRTYTMVRGDVVAPPAHGRAGSVARDRTAELQLAVACLLVALGGLALGLQVDARGRMAGTGMTPLAIGALVALVVTFLQHPSAQRVPRDMVSFVSAATGFCGVAFVVSGVLAPGGPWMFAEVVMLLWLLARRRSREQTSGPELLGSSLFALAFLLLFRLWITFRGSEHRWEVVTIDVPILSWIPLELFDPIKTISLGSFTPRELGFPEAGLDLPLSIALWALGFALCAAGLAWRSHAEMEHENDRIHATIQTLPPLLVALVERLLPEDEWYERGLHGLPERLRRKKLEALVREEVADRAAFHAAILASPLPMLSVSPGFAAEIQRALGHYQLAARSEAEAETVRRIGAPSDSGSEPAPPPEPGLDP